jgi:leader peptidase (prepilin peptidase) / N-methyltransferase
MPAFMVFAAALFGALVGSFSNVLIYRIPRKESIAFPPSRCPNCGHRLGVIDLFPIVSWLALGGKCRYCKAPISPRYPLIEAATALGYGLIAFYFPITVVGLATIGLFVFFTFLLVASAIDLEHFEIPDVFSVGGAIIGILFAFLASKTGTPELKSLPTLEEAIAGATIASGIMVMIGNYGGWAMRTFREPSFPDFPIGFMQVNLAGLVGMLLALLGVPGATLWGIVAALVSVAANVIAKKVVRIPDWLTLGGMLIVGFGAIFILPAETAAKVSLAGLASALSAAGAVALLAGAYYARFNDDEDAEGDPVAMGFGDTKFMGLIGAFIGWKFALVSVALGILIGAVTGIIYQIATKRFMKRTKIPFGPSLAAGALAALFFGTPILDWAVGLFSKA